MYVLFLYGFQYTELMFLFILNKFVRFAIVISRRDLIGNE